MKAPLADLALETSRRESSVVLAQGELQLERELGARAHASELVPCIEELLRRAGLERHGGRLPLARVFVGLGPGSYTGLRVGIALAQGLARGSGAALYGISSLEALAFEAGAEEETSVLLDARGGRFYHASFRGRGERLETLAAPRAVRAAELAPLCAASRLLLVQPGLLESAGLEPPPGARVRADARPHARAVLAVGRQRLEAGALRAEPGLEPLYLAEFGSAPRRPDGAERPRTTPHSPGR